MFHLKNIYPWMLGAAALAGTSCVEFNGECTPPIDDPDAVVTWLAEDATVSRPIVRTRETALGNAMADGYLHALDTSTDLPKPVVALENAGSIRDQGLCLTRTVLPKGPLPRRVLRDTVPFSNELVLVELTELELLDVLEHSVATISTPGVVPGGQFLNVAGLSVEVDCSHKPEAIENGVRTKGERVRKVTLAGGREFTRNDASTTAKVRVISSEFIASGGDGFLDFTGKTITRTDRLAYFAFEEWLKTLGPGETQPARLPLDPQKPRIQLKECD